MLEGILFDLDGVLVDSEGIYFRAVRNTFLRYGVKISKQEFVKRWMIEQTTTPGVIRDYGLMVSVDEVRALKEVFVQEYIRDLQMMPGALDFLQGVYEKYPLGIVSSASRNELLRKLGKFDLMKFFKISVSGDEVREKKPKPEPYLRGCELLGLNPECVLVVEDNPSGVKSGKDAGCKVIAKPDGFTANMDFGLADRVIRSFDEIDEDMIGELFGD